MSCKADEKSYAKYLMYYIPCKNVYHLHKQYDVHKCVNNKADSFAVFSVFHKYLPEFSWFEACCHHYSMDFAERQYLLKACTSGIELQQASEKYLQSISFVNNV